MMDLRVGSAPWLLRHELRLAVRAMGGSGFWLLVLGGGFGFAVMHFAAWGILRGADLRGTRSAGNEATSNGGCSRRA